MLPGLNLTEYTKQYLASVAGKRAGIYKFL